MTAMSEVEVLLRTSIIPLERFPSLILEAYIFKALVILTSPSGLSEINAPLSAAIILSVRTLNTSPILVTYAGI